MPHLGCRPGRIEALERSEGQGMGGKRQDSVAGMLHAMCGQGDDFLDDGFYPAALGAMARCVLSQYRPVML